MLLLSPFTVQTSQWSSAGLEDPDTVLMWVPPMRVSVPFLFINVQEILTEMLLAGPCHIAHSSPATQGPEAGGS